MWRFGAGNNAPDDKLIPHRRTFAPRFEGVPICDFFQLTNASFRFLNLVLDIGNTRLKIGLFDGNRLAEQANWTDWTLEELVSFGNQAGADRVIVSSVATPERDTVRRLAASFPLALELTHETPLPFANTYRTPETLGKDRLAAVAGAQALFPGRNCLVIDCGTCIKYDLLTADGVYRGGNIAPGAAMRIRAMHTFTARLPEVAMRMPEDMVGYSTETALQNGALRGAVLEMAGFAAQFEQRASPLTVVLTGGDAEFLTPHLVDLPGRILEPQLTLYGLNHILEFNDRVF